MSDDVLGEEELAAQISRLRDLWQEGRWREARRALLDLRARQGDHRLILAALGECCAAGQRWTESARWYEQALAAGYDATVADELEEARRQAARLAAGRGRALLVAAGVLAVVALVIVVAALLQWRSATSPAREPAKAGVPVAVTPRLPALAGRGSRASAAAPQVQATQPTKPQALSGPPAPGPRVPTPATASTPRPAALPPVKVTQTVRAPKTDEDEYLTQLLSVMSWPDGTPLSRQALVQFDPYIGYAFVTLTIPGSLRSGDLLRATLDAAYGAACALLKGAPQVRYVTVRAVYRLVKGADSRTVVAFRGNTSREAYEYWQRLKRRPSLQEMWSQVFASCWWNPDVPSGLQTRTRGR